MAFRKELIDFWAIKVAAPEASEVQSTHRQQVKALFDEGISMEDAFEFVFSQKPDKEAFQNWVSERRRVQPVLDAAQIPDVLSAEDLDFWHQHGYVVLKGVINEDACAAVRNAIWEYLGMSPDEPKSWYRQSEGMRGMMLRFCDHPALDVLRNSPKIYKAYCQLYGHTRIYKTIDKVSFNPPEAEGYNFLGSRTHWDTSLHLPVADEFQGLLYLTDTTALDGAFHCVPGFHHKLEAWIKALPEGTNPRDEALRVLQTVAVPGNAGDFVIWHQALPHCATPNRGKTPRLIQYLTYLSEDVVDSKVWI